MSETVRAVYRNGTFVPIVPCHLPDETQVDVVVQDTSRTIAPQLMDPEERAKLRREVVASMRRNEIPADAPRFTREELHGRS